MELETGKKVIHVQVKRSIIGSPLSIILDTLNNLLYLLYSCNECLNYTVFGGNDANLTQIIFLNCDVSTQYEGCLSWTPCCLSLKLCWQ